MIRLCIRVVDHNHLLGVNQIVGISIRVGIRTFNIVVSLGSVIGRFHGFVRLRPEVRGLHLPHMRKKLGAALVLSRSWLNSAQGSRGIAR